MRRSRRNGHGGLEFGGSGEDSFVAVVVTKLTGALLFILLLTMVIMALLPKAIDLPAADPDSSNPERPTLAIATPDWLPEAIAGRPYTVALAAEGGQGVLRWAIDGELPEGLSFDPETAQIRGEPKAGTPEPASLTLRVSDGTNRASRATRLVVYQPDRPLTIPSKYLPNLPPIPWRAWLEQGFGFLVLWLVHLVGMSTLANLQRWSLAKSSDLHGPQDAEIAAESADAVLRRFFVYRMLVRLASIFAAIALVAWLKWPRG